jgi:septum formation protein
MAPSHAFEALVLASTSPARRALVERLGLGFRFEAPGVDEGLPPGTPVHDAVGILAHRKAAAVQARWPGALVVGSDQLVAHRGKGLGKPADRAAAKAQLARLAGDSHDIVTGVCVLGPGLERTWVEVTRMTLFPLCEDELEGYLETGEWQGCAGSYRVEGAGQGLFCAIEGDRTNVQGLPMVSLVRVLREVGVRFFGPGGRRAS